VLVGVGEEQALRLYAPFFHRVATGRAWADISASPLGYEGEVVCGPGETLEEALGRMGRAGYSHVFIRPEAPEAVLLGGPKAPRGSGPDGS
jgi:hypothetical protein